MQAPGKELQRAARSRRLPRGLFVAAAVASVAALLAAFGQLGPTSAFVAANLVDIAPLTAPGILVAGWFVVSGAGIHTAEFFQGRQLTMVFAAALIGAITPVCGVTVLPLMVGLLGAGVPLAPVMAFWLSSPITDPAMIAATAATLGPEFAVGKTLAAFGLGAAGGLAVMSVANRNWVVSPLRGNRIVQRLGAGGARGAAGFAPWVWKDRARSHAFARELLSLTRLVLMCLIPAFAAEYLLGAALRPDALSAYVGKDSVWALPLAVFVGAPLYIDGFAALPLTRGLIDHGMSPGAGMAFMVAGGVVSIWGAVAIIPVLRNSVFLLYLALAAAGSLAAGWIYGIAVS